MAQAHYPLPTAHELEKFFTEFGHGYSAMPQLQPPVVNTEEMEQYFSQFKQDYDLFVESGGIINIWADAHVGKDEVRNCAVLGWLLDCHGSHGQGAKFLRWFLDALHEALNEEPLENACMKRVPQVANANTPYRTTLEKPYYWQEKDYRVDIVIENEAFLLFIEAKVDARERKSQLKNYNDILHSRACGKKRHGLIFLTRTGEHATGGLEKKIVPLRWTQIADAFEHGMNQSISSRSLPSQQPLWAILVQQFCQHIRFFKERA